MRKFLKTITLVAVAALGVVSCTENLVDDTITPSTTKGVTLYATTPSGDTSTKVGFEDNGDNGITLSWSAGDSFVLYDSNGDKIDTFTTELGDGSFVSALETTTLTDGATYTAKYNEDADPSNQDGDKIANLDAACKMEATFNYGTTDAIVFEHTMAIMTFKFTSSVSPVKLEFKNGDETYTVTYSEINSEDNIYTSHIMIDPCDQIPRTLTFTLYNNEETAYDIRTVETSIAYEAGCRYTASVSDLANTFISGLWPDHADDSFANSEYDPNNNIYNYSIATAAQFAYLAKLVNENNDMSGVTFTLTNNIDLSGHEWVAIGNDVYSFKGTFEGNSRSISNLYINQASSEYQGLFGCIKSATIQNVGVTSGTVTGEKYVGGIVGHSYSSSSVSNCYNKAAVNSDNTSNLNCIGGVVGYNQYSNVTKCYNSGTVTSKGGAVGGVVGYSNGYSSGYYVTDCYNTAEATVTSGNNNVGGVVGSNEYTTLANCYNEAAVISNDNNDNYTSYGYVGGVTGYNKDALIVNCYNSGSVTSENSGYVGGVTGYNYYDQNTTTVFNCYNTGAVTGSSSSVGGVVGYNNDSSYFLYCYYNNSVYEGNAVGINDNNNISNATTDAAKTTNDMQADDFVTNLNYNAYYYNDLNGKEDTDATQACAWKAVTGGYPTLDFDEVPSDTSI